MLTAKPPGPGQKHEQRQGHDNCRTLRALLGTALPHCWGRCCHPAAFLSQADAGFSQNHYFKKTSDSIICIDLGMGTSLGHQLSRLSRPLSASVANW